MSQIVTEYFLKWTLIHITFVAYIIIMQFTDIIAKRLPTPGCPPEGVLETSEIDCELKRQIVAAHNEFRQKIAQGLVPDQPPAENMQEMFWDEELARSAQRWSHNCTFAHSEPIQRINERFEVGENLGQTKSKAKSEVKDFRKHIQKWFNEHERFKYGPVTAETIAKSGHYSQIAAANSYLVGCGFSRFLIRKIYYRLYVCHYGPSGNIFDIPPYDAGDLNCTGELKPSEIYPNLCTRKDPPSQLDCITSSEAIGERMLDSVPFLPSTSDSTTVFDSFDNKRFLDEISNSGDIINGECGHTKTISGILHDGKMANNIQIDKMYNVIYVNGWRTHD